MFGIWGSSYYVYVRYNVFFVYIVFWNRRLHFGTRMLRRASYIYHTILVSARMSCAVFCRNLRICGLILEFAICGLSRLRDLRICDSGKWVQDFANLLTLKKVWLPNSAIFPRNTSFRFSCYSPSAPPPPPTPSGQAWGVNKPLYSSIWLGKYLEGGSEPVGACNPRSTADILTILSSHLPNWYIPRRALRGPIRNEKGHRQPGDDQ